MPDTTFPTRLGCDNCGHPQVKYLPVRSLITNYDFEEKTPCAYRLVNSDETTLLKCEFCQLPHLRVLWWHEEEIEVPHV